MALLMQLFQVMPSQLRASAAAPIPGPVDVGFAQFMIVHHDQAVIMSQIIVAHGQSEVSGMAISIQAAQLLEMGQMRGLLSSWNKPFLPSSKRMNWLLLGKISPDAALLRYIADCNASPGGMPGLATTEELNRLRELDGNARDLLFLQLMIRHHSGALPMAQFAARNADTPQIRGLATQILLDQTVELNRMEALLKMHGAALKSTSSLASSATQ